MKLQEIKDFVKELRGLSQEELAKKENELKKELFDLRFQAAAGQLDQTARLNEVKKQIARVKTCLLYTSRNNGYTSGWSVFGDCWWFDS